MVYAIPPLLRKQLEFKELTSGQTFHFQCLEVFSELVEVPLHFIVVPPPQVKKLGSSYVAGSVTPWEPQISLFSAAAWGRMTVVFLLGSWLIVHLTADSLHQAWHCSTVVLALLFVSCSYYLSVRLFILKRSPDKRFNGSPNEFKKTLGLRGYP